MSTFLGIDLGTGSAKAVLLDANAQLLRSAERRYSEGDGEGKEIQPDLWWRAVVEAVHSVDAGDVECIGVTGQMHGLVLCDNRGEALRPAFTWADVRARAQTAAFDALPEEVLSALGNPISPGMAGPLLLWVAENEPCVYRRARWALQPKDWLRLRLTGQVATDPTDASATLLYDVSADTWSYQALDLLNLRAELLPEVKPSATRAGELTADVAEELGLRSGLPVAIGAGDAAAALAAGPVQPGETLINVGSGGQVLSPTGTPRPHPQRLTNVYRGAASPWYAMAAVLNAGVAVEWVLHALCATWEELYEVALPGTPPASAGVLFIPRLLDERSPSTASDNGGWIGLRRDHSRHHLLRAALEGVAFEIRHASELLRDLGIHSELYWLGGGSTRWPLWRQLMADVLGRELHVLPHESRSAQGAARLAAEAIGAPLPSTVDSCDLAEPDETSAAAYGDAYWRYMRRTYPLQQPDDVGAR